jgi:hypothetical protein
LIWGGNMFQTILTVLLVSQEKKLQERRSKTLLSNKKRVAKK